MITLFKLLAEILSLLILAVILAMGVGYGASYFGVEIPKLHPFVTKHTKVREVLEVAASVDSMLASAKQSAGSGDLIASFDERSSLSGFINAGPSLVQWQRANTNCKCRIVRIVKRKTSQAADAPVTGWMIKTEPSELPIEQRILTLDLSPSFAIPNESDAAAAQRATAKAAPGAMLVAAESTMTREDPRTRQSFPVQIVVVVENDVSVRASEGP